MLSTADALRLQPAILQNSLLTLCGLVGTLQSRQVRRRQSQAKRRKMMTRKWLTKRMQRMMTECGL